MSKRWNGKVRVVKRPFGEGAVFVVQVVNGPYQAEGWADRLRFLNEFEASEEADRIYALEFGDGDEVIAE